MTSLNTGLRRTAIAALAVGVALGASACGGGQISQTANQMAAVDGGSGQAGDVHVNDLHVVLPEGGGEAKVGFVVSYTGSGFGEPVSLDSVEIDGTEVQLEAGAPLERGCTLVASTREDAAEAPSGDTLCFENATATLPGADDLKISQSVPATLSFSNGDTIETYAGVIADHVSSDYTRPAEPAPAEGH